MISAFVLILFLIIFALLFGYGLSWLWVRGGAAKPSTRPSAGMPACGRCGYPARGITTVHCPECGADLREVGIVRPGQSQGQGTMALVLFAGSIIYFILCGMLSELVEDFLPTYGNATARLSLMPTHSQYEARVRLETSETNWGHSYSNSLSFNLRSFSSDGSLPIQISLDGLTPEMQIDALAVELDLSNTPPGATYRPQLEIDPASAIATWQGLDGKTTQSKGPFTDQDMLRFLGASGMDEKQPQTIADAQQLHLFLDGVIQRKNQFTMTGFDSYSSGGSSSYGWGPDWFWPLYAVGCILLWIVGLVLIIRRSGRKRRPEQN